MSIINRRYAVVPIAQVHLHPRNARRGNVEAIGESIEDNGLFGALLVQESTGFILKGNHTYKAAVAGGEEHVPCIFVDVDDERAVKIMLADNRTSDLGGYDDKQLSQLLEEARRMATGLRGTGYDEAYVRDLLARANAAAPLPPAPDAPPGPTLADRFLVPPFSVLDARQGYWQDRKAAWVGTGIESEVGRGENLSYDMPDWMDRGAKRRLTWAQGEGKDAVSQKIMAAAASGTSVFDPVLCELIYRWFTPPDGTVLDPFAGGSVRGIVAAKLGRAYTGIELRPEQVAANRAQWVKLEPRHVFRRNAIPADNTPARTPIERVGDVWVKRDDTFAVAGVAGGKVRSCWHIAQGATGLVTAGSRASPQVNIVAHIARRLGVPCRVHVPEGDLAPEVEAARAAGAEVVQHKAGHNSVIVARAREDAAARGWREVPFGMECEEAVNQTRAQVGDLPAGVKRIVVPVGSGMSLAGVLHGLRDAGCTLPVLGVVVGANPKARLKKFAPAGWAEQCTLVDSGVDYHHAVEVSKLGPIQLDPIYEAKCLPFLEPGDLLWCVGIRQTALDAPIDGPPPGQVAPRWIEGDSAEVLANVERGEYDLVFSCPPYADLEQYSEDPRDLSNMPYDKFVAAYRGIIKGACARLKENRFACFVVGDIRGPDGAYRNFVGDTVQAFIDAGLKLYNDGVLVTAVGSLPVRTGRMFAQSRKMGKTHQNVLILVKGDPRMAAEACGLVETAGILDQEDSDAGASS